MLHFEQVEHDCQHTVTEGDRSKQVKNFSLFRARVPGGWLVIFQHSKYMKPNAAEGSGGVTFVPDPGHPWAGT